jgi:hypothetical protein
LSLCPRLALGGQGGVALLAALILEGGSGDDPAGGTVLLGLLNSLVPHDLPAASFSPVHVGTGASWFAAAFLGG